MLSPIHLKDFSSVLTLNTELGQVPRKSSPEYTAPFFHGPLLFAQRRVRDTISAIFEVLEKSHPSSNLLNNPLKHICYQVNPELERSDLQHSGERG